MTCRAESPIGPSFEHVPQIDHKGTSSRWHVDPA
eukprot:CAMPEP_0116855930 /NCGR_PEP_ID=MMETSP0418-20121206/19592_1 /TAXON_ID=1158023 /ORGANISM="Astrosyne radiata, Strain 13vi08-1A" /LENGTH=33 /DNA_ID= /DNA_START= /DNA_END= /DNA_ORIENTATION=